MKKILIIMILIATVSGVFAQNMDAYATSRASGTIMITGSGAYQTDLNQELRRSVWGVNTDVALFLFPQFAAGIDFGYGKSMIESGDVEDPTVSETVVMSLGPRVYFFLGGEQSQVTPFIKGGANYLLNKSLIDGDVFDESDKEMGLVASAGLLLNLAKNVGLSVEAEYSFEKGTAVEDIDTKVLNIKFGIRSFLGN